METFSALLSFLRGIHRSPEIDMQTFAVVISYVYKMAIKNKKYVLELFSRCPQHRQKVSGDVNAKQGVHRLSTNR